VWPTDLSATARSTRLSARDPSRTVLPVRRSLLVVIAAIRTVPLAAVQVHAHPYRGEREPTSFSWTRRLDLIWGQRVRRMVGPFTCSTSRMQVEDPSMAVGQGAPNVIAGSRMAANMQTMQTANMQVKTSAYEEGEDGPYD
jgi:hypothetical protein